MAEVSLTLIDPQGYQGQISAEPEIDIQDEMPAHMQAEDDDWDEASVRAAAAEDTESHLAEVQPGQLDWKEAAEGEAASAGSAGPADCESEAPDGAQTALEASPAGTEAAEPPAAAQPSEAEPNAEAAQAGSNAVVLKIRRRKFKPTVYAKGEIMVTRRLFRTGESEYLLNGKLCRLRDIQDIFMGTGLGPESYAIIEQGRIGQYMSSKPHDRRAILEEAAGITKFKTKKRLAEARLDQAKQNLARINDIFDEVTRQMRSLQRQAAKAERFAKVREEFRERLKVVLASKSAQLSTEFTTTQAELQSANIAVAERSQSVSELELAHTAAANRHQELSGELKAATQTINELSLVVDRASVQIKNNDERAAELERRSATATVELETSSEQARSLTAERGTNADVLASAAADVEAARAEAAQKQQEAMQANRNVSELERRIDERRSEMVAQINNGARIRSQIAQGEEQCAALTRDSERIEREIAHALSDIEAFGGRRGQLDMAFESVNERVQNLDLCIGEVRASLETKRREEGEAKRHADSLRAELATALGKRSSLETVIREHGYSTESVKRLLKSNQMQGGMTPAGVLADFLEVDDQYESVVDDFLRDELNYVVVKSWDAANEGMRLLKAGVDGRATFLVHPNDSQARLPFTVDELRTRPPQDRIVPLTSAMKVLDGFGRSLEVILPKLRDGYITPDAEIARGLALENPDAYFLAPTGETFHNVTVTGGKKAGEGPLALKRELRTVQKYCMELELGLQKEQAKVLLLGKEIAELSKLLDTLQDEKRDAERLVMTSGHALTQVKQEIARAEQRLSQMRLDVDRLVRSRNEKEERTSG